MNSITSKKPIFDPGLCRCCGSMKKCRMLNVEYECLDKKEIYSDMLMDCFGLLMSHLDGKPTERLVCATCVSRLRDALAFKQQVLHCEEAFFQMKMYDANHAEVRSPLQETLCDGFPMLEVKIIKSEPEDMDQLSDTGNNCEDTMADAPDDTGDTKPAMVMTTAQEDSSADDLPLINRVMKHKKLVSSKTRLSMLREQRVEHIVKPQVKQNDTNDQCLQMLKAQQLYRERDPTYMTETNILTIVEFSHVCPFKCRHNHLLCYYCGQIFPDPQLLREHTANLHHPKKFKVTEHKNMIKIDLTRIDCRLCPIKIDDLEEFKRHIVSIHQKKYYFDYKDSILPFKLTKEEIKCAICQMIFPYFHALNKHMNEHFSNYVCETCGLGFVDKSRFVMHKQRHEQGDYPCDTCGKIFKAEYNRDLHIDRVHRKRGRVYCPKCDIKLMSYPQKLKHLVEVHGEQPLSFPCNICDKVCETRRTLTIHWRKDHLKDFRYECQCCGQKFFTRFALNNHMPTHTGERNYKCKVCEKSYPRLKTLKDHMRIHNNDRRYRCRVCGQGFIQNCSLKAHMKSAHAEYG